MDKTRGRGFTLIEVLTVIAIIGILSAVVMVSVSNSQKKGRDGRRVSDINQIRLALSLYYDAHNSYPAGDGTTESTIKSVLTGGSFISVMPDDPSGGSYGYVATPSGCSDGSCYGYVLGANLESTNVALDTSYRGDQDIEVNGTPENCDTEAQGVYYLYCASN